MAIVRFNSLGDFARRCGEVSAIHRHEGGAYSGWYGDITYEMALSRAISGDDSLVSEAMAILDKLEASIESTSSQWFASPIGAYPVVPEFLVGLPDCMRRRVSVASEVAPVSVYVSTTCSGSIDSETMLKRGVAILALVLKLQAVRPVRLFLLAETHGANSEGELLQAIEINSQPLDLATVCYALTHVGFARWLTYSLARELAGFNGSWPREYKSGGQAWEMRLRASLDLESQDLYIGAAREWDPCITDSINWVNQQVARACNSEYI